MRIERTSPRTPSSSRSGETLSEDWAAVKLVPGRTGLPMAVRITENEGYPHDVPVKVGPVRGGRGSWRTAPSVAVRPSPREVVPGSLPAADIALVSRWIELHRDVIVDFSDGTIDTGEMVTRLRKLP